MSSTGQETFELDTITSTVPTLIIIDG